MDNGRKGQTMKTYIMVSQNNWKEEVSPREFRCYDKAPPTFEAAHDWPGTKVIESETAPTRFGHTTYAVNDDGTLAYVGNDCDSSG